MTKNQALTPDQRAVYEEAVSCGASREDALDAVEQHKNEWLISHRKTGQHREAIGEAGWCPECDEGELDPAWARRNGVDL